MPPQSKISVQPAILQSSPAVKSSMARMVTVGDHGISELYHQGTLDGGMPKGMSQMCQAHLEVALDDAVILGACCLDGGLQRCHVRLQVCHAPRLALVAAKHLRARGAAQGASWEKGCCKATVVALCMDISGSARTGK